MAIAVGMMHAQGKCTQPGRRGSELKISVSTDRFKKRVQSVHKTSGYAFRCCASVQ
jgi:hypothetical protein